MEESRIVELLMAMDSKLNNVLAKLENHEKEINELRDNSIKRIHERLDGLEEKVDRHKIREGEKRDKWVDYIFKTVVGMGLAGVLGLLAKEILG